MANDTFTAGVVPGGLTANSEIKILICHVLDAIKLPISQEDLFEALSGQGYANYFECADALSDLLNAGHVAQEELGFYCITPSGHEIAALLSGDVALTVRERTVKQALVLARRSNRRSTNTAEIVKNENGSYTLHCAVRDNDGVIFSLELIAPSLAAAQRMRDSFLDNAETILRDTIAKLTGEEF